MPNFVQSMSDLPSSAQFIAIGSNLAPEKNVPIVLDTLLGEFGELWLSSVVYTQPEGMDSRNHFLNAVCLLPTSWDVRQLKRWLSQLEIDLGRDRSHPDKKILDRAADLDILLPLTGLDQRNTWPSESYVRPMFLELIGALGLNGKHMPPKGAIPITLPRMSHAVGLRPVHLQNGNRCRTL